MSIKTCIFFLFLVLSLPLHAESMTQKEMESIFKEMGTDAEGERGSVGITFKEVRVFLVSDPIHNRMRLLVPIAKYEDLNRTQVDAVMISNFHLALDARYAVSKGILYSVYLHPLEELNKEQIQSAVRQVANLALTFGSTFTSGELTFGLEQKKKPIY